MESLNAQKIRSGNPVPVAKAIVAGTLSRRLGGPLAALLAVSCAISPQTFTGMIPGVGQMPVAQTARINPALAIELLEPTRMSEVSPRPQTVSVRIIWPSSRTIQTIPDETNSIRLSDFGPDGNLVAMTSVSRPPQATSSMAVVPADPGLLLPIGNNTLLAEALDGTGAVVASGSVVVAIQSNRAVDAKVTLEPRSTPAPAIGISTFPADAKAHVGVNNAIAITFDQAMNPATISTASFTLTQDGTPVAGTVASSGSSAIFTPDFDMIPNAAYTATVTTAARSVDGGALAADKVWSFMTGEKPVVLGMAGTFAVLGGSTVTSVGQTTINGDLGLWAGTATSGFPPGTVNGTIHVNDPTAVQGQADLGTAYDDAAGRTVAPVTLAGNIGGLTLTPGIYKSTSSLAISSGDLTLDAQGDANAVFIFQMATTLTTTAGRLVILGGGAKAANVYWQVGSSATLGTTSVFKGTIMAYASITLNADANLEGRALTQIGAVSMDGNTITKPTP